MQMEEVVLKQMYKKGYLNEKGLKRYIKYLKGEVKDYSERICEALTQKQ